jgi:DNA-binding transcriptional LysR family regulator
MPGAGALAHLAISLPEALSAELPPERELKDLSFVRDIPFIPYPDQADLSRRMSRMLGAYHTAPCQVNTADGQMQYDLMRLGLGAVVISRETVFQRRHNAEDVLLFAPASEEACRTVCLSVRHSAEDDPAIRSFIQVAKQTCKTLNENICL